MNKNSTTSAVDPQQGYTYYRDVVLVERFTKSTKYSSRRVLQYCTTYDVQQDLLYMTYLSTIVLLVEFDT